MLGDIHLQAVKYILPLYGADGIGDVCGTGADGFPGGEPGAVVALLSRCRRLRGATYASRMSNHSVIA